MGWFSGFKNAYVDFWKASNFPHLSDIYTDASKLWVQGEDRLTGAEKRELDRSMNAIMDALIEAKDVKDILPVEVQREIKEAAKGFSHNSTIRRLADQL